MSEPPDPPLAPASSNEGRDARDQDRVLRAIRVAQAAAIAVDLCAEASHNEALTWVARASRALLGLAALWRLQRHR